MRWTVGPRESVESSSVLSMLMMTSRNQWCPHAITPDSTIARAQAVEPVNLRGGDEGGYLSPAVYQRRSVRMPGISQGDASTGEFGQLNAGARGIATRTL